MSNKDLPSIDEFSEESSNLPSIDEFITEEVEEDLPSVEDFIEKEQEIITEQIQTIEDANGDTFAEVQDIVPPWPELVKMVNDIRADIPDIPEIKYYDKELEQLAEQIAQVRDEIPEVPEVRYYESEVEAICGQIDLVREEIKTKIQNLPEIKYYDEQVDQIEDRIDILQTEVTNLPKVKYYDEEIKAICDAIDVVKASMPVFPKWVNEVNEVPDFSWIGKTFSVIDDDFIKVNDTIDTLKEHVKLDIKKLVEENEVKHFENKIQFGTEVKDLDVKLGEEKDKIWKELRSSSMRIWEYHKEFKDDDKKLKKQIKNEYNSLKNQLEQNLSKYNLESVKTDELLLNYFNGLKEEVSSLPEVKYYDDDISSIKGEISSLRSLVQSIKTEQKQIKDLQEGLLNEPPSEKEDVGSGADPLTPMDQKFATLDDLAGHYRLFINRVQQQIATIGGGGAGFIKDLDDVSFDQTTGTDKLLIYNGAKWVGIASTALSGSSDSDLDDVLSNGNSSSQGMSVGVLTATSFSGDGSGLTGVASTDNIITSTAATFNNTTQLQDVQLVGIVTGLSVSGVSTFAGNITAPTLSGNVSGTAATFTGELTAASASFTGNVSVGGTLTYEDVTNIDSVGVITARLGVNVTGGQITVGAAFSVGQAGVVTASSFVGSLTGSASSLSGVSSSFLLDYNNFSNTPTIPTNNNQLTNGAGFITTSFTNTNQLTNGAGFITASDDITGNAATSTELATARTIAGVSFDGSANISLNNNAITNGAGYITTSFTNTNQLTNGAGFITTSFTNTNQLTNGAGFITASDNITGTSAGLTGTPNITVGGVSAGDINVSGATTTNTLEVTSTSQFKNNTKHFDGKFANFGNSNDLQIVHDGSNAVIQNATGAFFIDNNSSGGDLFLRADDDVVIRVDGNDTVFTAQTGGIDVTGHTETDSLNVSGVATATSFSGSGASLSSLNGSNISSGTVAAARVATLNQDTSGNAATATALETARTIAGVSFDGTANISLNNNAITNGAGYITSADGGNAATLDSLDSTQFLRSDTSDTFSGTLTVSGNLVPNANNSRDLGTTSLRWANLYTADMHFSNKGSKNSVDGTWGDWTLQEGDENIYMLNNRTGKKYKMNLTEVE